MNGRGDGAVIGILIGFGKRYLFITGDIGAAAKPIDKMKSKIIISVITTAMVFLGGYVFAFESGDAANYQAQVQDLSGVDYGITGADSKYGGAQVDVGASSTNGGNGMEYNHQGQGAHVNAINSTGTARHQYDVDMETRGASTSTGWGRAAHIEIHGTIFGVLDVTTRFQLRDPQT